MAEHRTVDARVVGSTPISHPGYETPDGSLFCFLIMEWGISRFD